MKMSKDSWARLSNNMRVLRNDVIFDFLFRGTTGIPKTVWFSEAKRFDKAFFRYVEIFSKRYHKEWPNETDFDFYWGHRKQSKNTGINDVRRDLIKLLEENITRDGD